MEQFYLEKPSLKRKNDIIDYINELVIYNSEINGIETLAKILDDYTFEQALDYCLNLEEDEFAKKLGKSQVKTFLLIRVEDNKIVGALNVRFNFTEKMNVFDGNIGYGIRPLERRKGYNKINLYLGLLESQKVGLDKVNLVCEANNLGSVKTIESLGGILEKTGIDPVDGVLTNLYSIDVGETINKYKETYENNFLV